jgi:hypothetical protein
MHTHSIFVMIVLWVISVAAPSPNPQSESSLVDRIDLPQGQTPLSGPGGPGPPHVPMPSPEYRQLKPNAKRHYMSMLLSPLPPLPQKAVLPTHSTDSHAPPPSSSSHSQAHNGDPASSSGGPASRERQRWKTCGSSSGDPTQQSQYRSGVPQSESNQPEQD